MNRGEIINGWYAPTPRDSEPTPEEQYGWYHLVETGTGEGSRVWREIREVRKRNEGNFAIVVCADRCWGVARKDQACTDPRSIACLKEILKDALAKERKIRGEVLSA